MQKVFFRCTEFYDIQMMLLDWKQSKVCLDAIQNEAFSKWAMLTARVQKTHKNTLKTKSTVKNTIMEYRGDRTFQSESFWTNVIDQALCKNLLEEKLQ